MATKMRVLGIALIVAVSMVLLYLLLRRVIIVAD